MSLAHALILAALLVAKAPRDVEFTKDTLAVVSKNVATGKAVLVDVRGESEWKQGHFEGSIFIPVTSLRKGGDRKAIAKKLPKNKIIYTFCVVGMRAKTAAFELGKQGYNIRALKPGYDDLLKAGFKKAKQEIAATEDEGMRPLIAK
jgi:rhodanese-related sulfurtransferase